MELEKYNLIEKIGSGSYGQVFKAEEKATGRSIAVKLITKKRYPSERERKDQKKFLKECKIHSSLRHPYIIEMIDSFETIEFIIVATELAETDLHQLMARQKLADKHVQRLTWHLLSALHYLHSQRVSHRDLKPQNILLNNHQNLDAMEAKLCDFGLAQKMTQETYLLTSVKGTPLYMAPEVMGDQLYDEKADLWSLGIVIYEAHFGKPPIKTNIFAQLTKWLKNPQIEWPSPISEEPKSFIQGLLKKDPKMRSTWPQILNHPYVKDNIYILSNKTSERPLTEDLTTSQQIRKDRQRKEIILHRDKKMITDAMMLCQEKGKISQMPLDLPIAQNAQRKNSNVIGENESISSDDSINAIIQTDLETDVEGPLIKKEKKLPPTDQAAVAHDNQNQNFVIKRYMDNFTGVQVDGRECNENANLKIGTMLENMEKMQIEDKSKRCTNVVGQMNLAPNHPQTPMPIQCGNKNINNTEQTAVNNQTKDNTGLVKRKLSQNLEKFSIRLGNENHNDDSKEKSNTVTLKTQNPDRNEPENLSPKHNTYDSPSIENEEWLAYIHMSMAEVLNGEIDTLKDQNLLGIIVAILRNPNVSSNVIGSIVQLLSIPFVLPISDEDLTQIRIVYVQTKLLPNLIYASKIVCMVKENNNPSFSSTLSSSNFGAVVSNEEKDITFRKMSDLSADLDLKTLASIYELVCYLIHFDYHFVNQFCDSIHFIAKELLPYLLGNVVYDSHGMKIVCAIVSTLCYVLRETPEYGDIVEWVIFHESVDMISLFNNGNDILKCRLCNLLKISSRYSCLALEKAWTKEWRQTLEGLVDDANVKVKDAAKDTIEEISQLSFYNK